MELERASRATFVHSTHTHLPPSQMIEIQAVWLCIRDAPELAPAPAPDPEPEPGFAGAKEGLGILD